MKKLISKTISAIIAAAVILNTGIAAIPNPNPVFDSDSSITIIETKPGTNEDESGEENENNPQCDDPVVEILQ